MRTARGGADCGMFRMFIRTAGPTAHTLRTHTHGRIFFITKWLYTVFVFVKLQLTFGLIVLVL
jgi:hypothetical protein